MGRRSYALAVVAAPLFNFTPEENPRAKQSYMLYILLELLRPFLYIRSGFDSSNKYFNACG